MKKYLKSHNLKKRTPFFWISFALVCTVLFITVGFSSLTSSLSINGNAAFAPVGLIRVMSMTQYNLNNAEELSKGITPDSVKNRIDLNGSGSSATYEVKIRNFGQIDYVLDSILEEVYSNDQIEYVLDGFQIGDVIEAGEEVTFRVTYKYKDSATAPLEPRLNSELRFVFEEYQDVSGYTKYYRRLVFDGTNYINTGIALFSEENFDKDFEIYFEIADVGENQETQSTLMNAKNETGSPWPGMVYRIYGTNEYELSASNYVSSSKPRSSIATTKKVSIKRENGMLYIKINDGSYTRLLDMSLIPSTFDVPVTFGASLDGNGNPQRYFVGTLENVHINLIDPEKYTIAYDANGGTGSMDSHKVRIGNTAVLSAKTFTRTGYAFRNWNTKADGTGTTYEDGQQVTDIGANGETVTLYAMWVEDFRYTVAYNANGGTGSMESQEFQFGETKNLKTNEFTRTNYAFIGWNTKADGTGTKYEEGQSVKNLAQTSGDTITLYAIWMNLAYDYPGEYVFTGSNYIDTGVYLFNEANKNKDFVLSFEIVSHTSTSGQATLMNAKDETGSPWPGMAFRVSSASEYEFTASNYVTSQRPKYKASTTEKVTIKRENNILYIKVNDGSYTQLFDMSRIPSAFNVPVTFGSSLDGSGNPQRYFVESLKNMRILLS